MTEPHGRAGLKAGNYGDQRPVQAGALATAIRRRGSLAAAAAVS